MDEDSVIMSDVNTRQTMGEEIVKFCALSDTLVLLDTNGVRGGANQRVASERGLSELNWHINS